MSAEYTHEPSDAENTPREPEPAPPAGEVIDDDDFHLQIRKLELPVRPRGVLAE